MDHPSKDLDHPDEGAQAAAPNGTQAERLQMDDTGIPAAIRMRPVFGKLPIELGENDLANPAVVKMLLDTQLRLEAEVSDLRQFVTRFHEANTRAEVLDAKLRGQTSLELLYGFTLAAGGIFIGLGPALWKSQPEGFIALSVGIVLFIASIAIRVRSR